MIPDHFKVTHTTDWRRVRWVYDNDYQGLVEGIDEDDPVAKEVAQRELEDLRNGNLVCLGAIIETKCRNCIQWETVDSLWNIIVEPDDDLEALGSEILEIPESRLNATDPMGTIARRPCRNEVDQVRLDKLVETREERRPKGLGLARIVLQFDPDTFAALRGVIALRAVQGQSWGLLEQFVGKLLDKIRSGAPVWEVD